LLGVGVERNADDGIHIGSILTTSYMNISRGLEKSFKPRPNPYA